MDLRFLYARRKQKLLSLIGKGARFEKDIQLANAIDRPADYVSRMLKAKAAKKAIGEKIARDIEYKLGKPWGWLDETVTGDIDDTLSEIESALLMHFRRLDPDGKTAVSALAEKLAAAAPSKRTKRRDTLSPFQKDRIANPRSSRQSP